ncbi:TnsD family Tn7-like transposition protein [Herbaspirillum frisingense]|uniref:TnsD family Tn7-like transposition protein n=1 Tax=Herbaspirillum frisingense TaxID=92645 RepID=UPI001F2DAFB4|nr:TnsD family transposase [Herbaspirillum frisingense]UIN21183.1 TnsD family transposase [Herbaspirillum frisingense]
MPKIENLQIRLPFREEFHVKNWLPDETFYSLCGRIHQVSGVIDSAVTCQRLFGHRLQGVQHDIPSRLNHFVERTSGVFGSAEEILQMHSILAFHFFLKPSEVRSTICRSLAEGGVGSAKYQLGLLSSRFRAHHPLRLCPQCAVLDREEFGVCYWHLSHQYPGVWFCDRHGCVLKEADAKANGVGRFLWFLPDYVSSYRVGDEKVVPGRTERLKLLAEIVSAIATCGMSMAISEISALYAERAKDLLGVGVVRPRLDLLAQEFAEFIRPLAGIEEFQYFSEEYFDIPRYLGCFLSGVRAPKHVLHHALMIGFLFGGWNSFLDKVSRGHSLEVQVESQSEIDDRHSSDSRKYHPKKERALLLLLEGSRSISAIAHEMKVDIGTMQAWAAQAGKEVRRRPKSLQSGVRRAIVEELKVGKEKRVVANDFGVSEQAITRLLRTEIGLHQQWCDARLDLEIARRKEVWESLLAKNPTLSMSELRKLEPAHYAWLYRNEKTWLRASASSISRPVRNYVKEGLWEERDLKLSALIGSVILQIVQADRGKERVTLQDVYRARPEIRPMLSQLDKLPRTRKVLLSIGKKRTRKKGLFDDAD